MLRQLMELTNAVFMLMYGAVFAVTLAEIVKRYPLHTTRRAFYAGFLLGCFVFAIRTIFL